MWILNALWLLPMVLWFADGKTNPAAGPLDILYFGVTALFWIGHRLSSTWLAYFTEAYRPLLRLQPLRFVVAPLLITVACFAVVLPPETALAWPRAQRLVALAIVDYAFGTYHFGAQHFGALSLYRARSGCGSRWRDRAFALGVGGGFIFLADILAGDVAYQDKWIDHGLLPAQIASAAGAIRTDALIVLCAVTAAMLVAEIRVVRPSLPRILYVLGLAAMVAVALRPRSLFPFLVIWTSQHWILATGLATRAPNRELAPPRGNLRQALHMLNRRPWAILALLMALSAILLPVFEVEANNGSACAYYGDRIFGAFARSLRTSAWVPALIALGFATGFIHYLHDRNVYRLSDRRVREAARGLLAPRQSSNS
ncbi:MAG TPA: hypothetical protein VMU22_04080 [Rhizomicrobium sp.]|nr:hypothetical protein [Rhizomicrobium sp.]